MKFEAVDKLAAMLDDYAAARAIFSAELRSSEETCDAIAARLEAERAAQDGRRAELREILEDGERGQSNKHLAQLELDRMADPEVAPEERDCFMAHAQSAREALDELWRSESKIKAAFDDVKAELSKARKDTIGNSIGPDLLIRSLEGAERSFGRLPGANNG